MLNIIDTLRGHDWLFDAARFGMNRTNNIVKGSPLRSVFGGGHLAYMPRTKTVINRFDTMSDHCVHVLGNAK